VARQEQEEQQEAERNSEQTREDIDHPDTSLTIGEENCKRAAT
jgi:hypothetical protein